jgi:hypothetical protein
MYMNNCNNNEMVCVVKQDVGTCLLLFQIMLAVFLKIFYMFEQHVHQRGFLIIKNKLDFPESSTFKQIHCAL